MPAIHLASEEEYTEESPLQHHTPPSHKLPPMHSLPSGVKSTLIQTPPLSSSLSVVPGIHSKALCGQHFTTLWELKHGTPLLSLPGRLGLRSQGEGPLLS